MIEDMEAGDLPENSEPPDVSWAPPLGISLLIHVPSVPVVSRVGAINSSRGAAVGASLEVIIADVLALGAARRRLASQRIPIGA